MLLLNDSLHKQHALCHNSADKATKCYFMQNYWLLRTIRNIYWLIHMDCEHERLQVWARMDTCLPWKGQHLMSLFFIRTNGRLVTFHKYRLIDSLKTTFDIKFDIKCCAQVENNRTKCYGERRWRKVKRLCSWQERFLQGLPLLQVVSI